LENNVISRLMDSFGLTKSPGNVVFRFLAFGVGEHRAGIAEFDQITEVHVGGEVGDARGLLHVVGDDDDGKFFLQFVYQFFDVRGGNRIQCGSRLIEQEHLRLDGDGAGDAQTLLLPAGQASAALFQLVLHFHPQRGLFQCPFHAIIHIVLVQIVIEFHAEGDVVVDGHRERGGFLEHHAYLGAQGVEILLLVQKIFPIQQNFASGSLLGVELVHAVEGAQQRGLTAAGRADEGGHHFFRDGEVDVLEGAVFAVVKIQVAHDQLRGGGFFSIHLPVSLVGCCLLAEQHARHDIEREYAEGD